MESIPTVYLVFVYGIIALPYVIAIVSAISLIAIAVLYFTNRRKTALKILKVLGITLIIVAAFAWLTKSSLGL